MFFESAILDLRQQSYCLVSQRHFRHQNTLPSLQKQNKGSKTLCSFLDSNSESLCGLSEHNVGRNGRKVCKC